MSLEKIIATGSYSGDGASQSISIGWQPAMVMIVSSRTTGPSTGRGVAFKFADMAGDDFACCETEAVYTTSNGITLTSDGFSVGSDDCINKNAQTFYWVAFRECPAVDTGSYTGGGTGQTITTGRQPDAVFIFDSTSSVVKTMHWKFSSMASAYCERFDYDLNGADVITLASNGFTVSGSADASGETFYWVAFYNDKQPTRHTECVTWSGDGGGDKTVTLGYQPKFVLICRDLDPAEYDDMDFKTIDMASSGRGELHTDYTWETGGTCTISSTGFTTDQNASGETYYALVGIE
jgi:hypothetical protein